MNQFGLHIDMCVSSVSTKNCVSDWSALVSVQSLATYLWYSRERGEYNRPIVGIKVVLAPIPPRSYALVGSTMPVGLVQACAIWRVFTGAVNKSQVPQA